MKLYRIAGHAWAGTQAEAKALAKEQGTAWQPVEVPTDKPGLLAWLNDEGRVIPATEPEILDTQLAQQGSKPQPWILGPPTRDPPRVAPRFLGDLAAQADFVPVAKAAEIDRLLARCPSCHRSAIAALDAGHVADWVRTFAGLDELRLVAETIRAKVAELGAELEERTVQ